MNLAEWFRKDLIGHIIEGFPYKEQYCRYCERECFVKDAIHLMSEPEHYKALYICDNLNCPVFDEDAHKQYAKVYYSSDKAYHDLELHRIYYERVQKG